MAFVAVTVSVDEIPDEIAMGFAVIVTIGAGFETPATLPPHPVTSRARKRLDTIVAEKSVRLMEERMHLLIKVIFLACS